MSTGKSAGPSLVARFIVHMSNKTHVLVAAMGLVLQSYVSVSVAQPPQAEVVASGLLSPRGLDFAPNGQLFVAEAGKQVGPDEPSLPPCHVSPRGPNCYTETGAVSLVDPFGIAPKKRVITGLPTLGDVGPADISFFGMQAYVAIGLARIPIHAWNSAVSAQAKPVCWVRSFA